MLKIITYYKQLFNKASSDRKLYVYLFCLFLAVFFWLLNALGNNYSTSVLFKVKYENQPLKKVILSELPQELTIKIKGLGFDLMGYKLKLKDPIIKVDLELLNLGNQSNNNGLTSQTILTSSFLSDISSQLNGHLEIQNILPKSIHIVMDKKIEKILPITPNVDISYAKQHQLFGNILIKPAVVRVTGAQSVLDTLKMLYTENINLQNLSESTNQAVAFIEEYESLHLSFKPSKVLLYVPVEKFTETSKIITIQVVNVPDSIELKTIPNNIEVKFMLPLSKMARLESAVFVVEVDYNKINKSNSRKLQVDLIKFPEYINSVNLNPTRVEYIIKNKYE